MRTRIANSSKPAGIRSAATRSTAGRGWPPPSKPPAREIGEMWNSANMAFCLAPMLTSGVLEAFSHHANDEQRQRFVPKLVSGEWTGTMNLTEPQAGSDL